MLIKNVSDYLSSFVIGIRFRANFSIEDQLGRIVDDILYAKGAFFGPKFFPLVEGRVNVKRLFNEPNDRSLLINNSNLVLEIEFNKDDTIETLTTSVREKFKTDIVYGVMKKYGVTQITRIGYINRYVFHDKHVSKAFLEQTIGSKLEGVNDTNLRFSKKYPTMEGMIKKDIDDYDNVIFNLVKQSDSEELFVSIDYQHIYSPFIEKSTDMDIDAYYKSVDKFNNETFKNWFNESYGISNGKN